MISELGIKPVELYLKKVNKTTVNVRLTLDAKHTSMRLEILTIVGVRITRLIISIHRLKIESERY